jgi:plastocyanin
MSFPRLAFVLGSAALFATPAASQPAAAFVVQVWSFGFAPHPIHLAAGRPVTLTFVNQSGSTHDFTAPGFFRSATVTAGAVPQGEIDLGPHQTRSVTLVPARGVYRAHCSHFLHKQMGMDDEIIVD